MAHDHRVELIRRRHPAEGGGNARTAVQQNRRLVSGDEIAGARLPVCGHSGPAAQDDVTAIMHAAQAAPLNRT